MSNFDDNVAVDHVFVDINGVVYDNVQHVVVVHDDLPSFPLDYFR